LLKNLQSLYSHIVSIFWVGPEVPNGPARPQGFFKMGRPMALEIGLKATGPGPRPGLGRPDPIFISGASDQVSYEEESDRRVSLKILGLMGCFRWERKWPNG
jgi:hypothetical protein